MTDLEQLATQLARASEDTARLILHSVGLTLPDECRHERAQRGDRFCQICGKRLEKR